jgi:predicted phosphodiesterase
MITDLDKKERSIFIGDIHGCYEELKKLLKKINYSPEKDRLISLGDLIHKGPKSAKVIRFFHKNNIEVIMGNHDWTFYQTLLGKNEMYNEAKKILKKLELSQEELITWFQSMPFYIEGQDFIAVHGALNPSEKKFYKTSPEEMLFGRYYDSKSKSVLSRAKNKKEPHISPWYKAYPESFSQNKTIIFGHWANPEAIIYKRFRGLDTGCCYGGHLSCYILPDDEIVQVKSKQDKMYNY